MKRVRWLGDSRRAMSGFPDPARQAAGYQLFRVQGGDEPSDWKPMPSIGAGVREIRVRAEGAWRVIYLATRPEAVYVLHAFGKKSQRTAKADVELARQRFKALLAALQEN